MSKALVICCLALCAWTGSLHAGDLYSGEVLVDSQGADERTRAVPAALIQVLQKLSGQRELPISPALDSALLSANRIMVSFHYRDRQRTTPDGRTAEEIWLVARFLPAAVDRIVRDLELPRWRQERRPVTVWAVVDDGLGRRLMPVEYAYAWDTMAEIAAMRGLPMAWPKRAVEPAGGTVDTPGPGVAQVTDSAAADGSAGVAEAQVDLQLLWGGFTEQLIEPGSRSGGVAIVAARREGPDWNMRWTYSDGLETDSWRSRDRDLASSLAGGMHRLADLVAARNSIAAAGQREWQFTMDVGGIAGAGDYARCLAYLEGLSLVNRVDIVGAGPGSVQFNLELNAAPAYLLESISRDGVLESGPAGQEYRLLP